MGFSPGAARQATASRPELCSQVRAPDLADGTRLTGLRDAANLFAMRFATVKSWRLPELEIERLTPVAESAERITVKIATDAIEHVVMAEPSPSPNVRER